MTGKSTVQWWRAPRAAAVFLTASLLINILTVWIGMTRREDAQMEESVFASRLDLLDVEAERLIERCAEAEKAALEASRDGQQLDVPRAVEDDGRWESVLVDLERRLGIIERAVRELRGELLATRELPDEQGVTEAEKAEMRVMAMNLKRQFVDERLPYQVRLETLELLRSLPSEIAGIDGEFCNGALDFASTLESASRRSRIYDLVEGVGCKDATILGTVERLLADETDEHATRELVRMLGPFTSSEAGRRLLSKVAESGRWAAVRREAEVLLGRR